MLLSYALLKRGATYISCGKKQVRAYCYLRQEGLAQRPGARDLIPQFPCAERILQDPYYLTHFSFRARTDPNRRWNLRVPAGDQTTLRCLYRISNLFPLKFSSQLRNFTSAEPCSHYSDYVLPPSRTCRSPLCTILIMLCHPADRDKLLGTFSNHH